MSSSASSRRTGAPRPRRCSTGLEVLPRRRIDYKGRVLEEMDLDALLARRPALALVDELAHTNAPGSRHPKRYLDVEELLAAGIDVFTTLNIQHVESLNDVVARITRIRVRETVPDSLLDRADDIEVVDLAPTDLIQRLNDGKVYVARTAERALRHYFSPGNLTALRELALRRTAQRVDAQLLDHMQAHAIEGPWPAGDRLLVCVTRRSAGAALVRYGRRLAERLRAPWTALHVETPATLRLAEPARDRIAETLRLAQTLGAEAVTIPGREPAEAILAYAREGNFSHVVIGNAPRRRWRLRPTVVERLIADAGGISVHVLGIDASEAAWRAGARGGAGVAPYPLWRQLGAGRRRGAHRHGVAGGAGDTLDRARVSHRRPDRGGELGVVAVAVRGARERARLQLLLPAAALHLHDRRSGERGGAGRVRDHRGGGEQPRGVRARAGDRGPLARAHHAGTLSVQPQARRHRHASTICSGRPPTRSRRC